jgi:hypothetical protein
MFTAAATAATFTCVVLPMGCAIAAGTTTLALLGAAAG